MSDPSLLEVENLCLEFDTQDGTFDALNDISFAIDTGEILGVVGESGAGKSVLGRTILGLIADNGRITAGEIRFNGTDLVEMSTEEFRKIRGNDISIIFQNAAEALNPTLTIGRQIKRVIRWNTETELSDEELENRAIEILSQTGIPTPGDRLDDYPHEFSGGMKQRVLISMALVGDPSLIVADEPTTALDVTIEAQILQLLEDLQAERDLSIMYITHNLAVENYISDRLLILYAGEVAEIGPTREVLSSPRHPYTTSLLESVPTLEDERMEPIPGSMPDISDRPSGCRFHPRCPHATDLCEQTDPVIEAVDSDSAHTVACHHHEEIEGPTRFLQEN